MTRGRTAHPIICAKIFVYAVSLRIWNATEQGLGLGTGVNARRTKDVVQ